MRILPLYLFALALLCAHLLLLRREKFAPALVVHALCCACSLWATWLGVDFSPSFTMMFLFANLLLCALAEWLRLIGCKVSADHHRLGQALAALHGALFALGTLFSLPAVYIYAAGDDMLERCVRLAIVCGTILAAGAAISSHGYGKPIRLPLLALGWFVLCAGCFALDCGMRSPALLPYAAGLFLMNAAILLDGREALRNALFCLGLGCASVFAVAPML